MIRTIFSRTDIFLLFVIFITFLSSLILTIYKCIKKAIITFALATILLILFLEEYYNKHKFFHSIRQPSKIANQQSHSQSSPTSSQENPTIPTTTQNPQTSTRISFQDNPHTFEERHARLSEPLEPVQRQASLSEPTYNLYPTLPQELSRIRNISQNQNTVEINRQIIHPRRNRDFQTPRFHFDIPQSPSPSTPENPISILPETPTLLSQRITSSIPSDYLGSTPTSEQIRDNPFNPPPPTKHHDYHIGQHTHSHKVNKFNK